MVVIKTISKMTPVLKTGIVILLDFDGLGALKCSLIHCE